MSKVRPSGPVPVRFPAHSPLPGRSADFASLLRNTLFHLSIGLALAIASAVSLSYAAALAPAVAARSAVLYGVLAGFVLLGLASHPFRRFGAANLVTTLRGVAACTLAALVSDVADLPPPVRDTLMWGVVGVAIVAVALDGIDGFIARRRGEASAFGARYDMEVDAFLILVLSILAFTLGKAGVWVLAIGLMRYAFLGAGRLWPWIEAELPPSRRRKVVCAVQGVVLCIIVSPPLAPPLSSILAAWILFLLAWSFVTDLVWLRRRA